MAAPRRTALVAAALGIGVLLTTPGALGQSLSEKQAHLQGKISSVKTQIEYAKRKEGVLSSQIQAASSDIKSLEGDISVLSGKLSTLESELAAAREKLAALEARYERQTKNLERLRKDYRAAQQVLERRLVDLYENEPADTVALVLQVESLGDLIAQIDFLNEIALQDQRIAARLDRLKGEMRVARRETGKLRDAVAEQTAAIAAKTEEARAAQAQLVSRQQSLEAARTEKSDLLAGVQEKREGAQEDLDAMLAASAQIAAQIQAAQAAAAAASSGGNGAGGGGGSTGGGAAPSSGFVWPVNGVVTSGFGPRWGRMHEGIDIAAPTGTAVRAVAAGRVIYAGGMGGYGNIVIVDHGGGLSTAYAHLSAIWVGGGSVSQGQGIGAVGCTGSCTGPHLHFEVRVNGSAVNPMGYL